MKLSALAKFSAFGLSTIMFRRKKPILGTIILTDKCNLYCRHCAVNNVHSVIYPYEQIKREMESLYKMGVRILFFSGGETLMWEDSGKTVRDLVIEAKQRGFLIVNIVTNGTFPIDLPEADLILLSLDGGREVHNFIRGDTYDLILKNIREATAANICFYMAVNRLNKHEIPAVCGVAKSEPNVKAVSFNFHTPYPGTEELSLTAEDKEVCCKTVRDMKKRGYPIFNLISAFPYLLKNKYKRPCRQCVVIENGRLSTCGRCIHNPGLCQNCGYIFAVEYSLIFAGKIRVIWDMLNTYLRYI